MRDFTRRDSLKVGVGALAAGTMLGGGTLRAEIPIKDVAPPKFDDRAGRQPAGAASVQVRRGRRDACSWRTRKKFTETTGVEMKVDIESWEDLRPKTAVAANVGSGPDIVLAWSDDPHKFAAKCLDLDRSRHLSRREVWRLVAAGREATARAGRPASWIAHADRRLGRARRLSQVLGQRGRLRDDPDRSRRLPRALPEARRRTAIRPASRSATPSATAMPGATG